MIDTGDQVKQVISLGAGVQSSTMALMAAHGEITPMPDLAIFADTQDEPDSVYRWLEWLKKQLPFPVETVTSGQLSAKSLDMRVTKDGRKFSKVDIPFFTLNSDFSIGKITHRSCTYDFKIKPIIKQLRSYCQKRRKEDRVLACSWIGISLDEVNRMKPSRESWIEHRWPLVEKRMTRQSCIDWMLSHGYPQPPRSSCVYCPFHSNAEWRRLQRDEPEAFARAVEFEKQLQAAKESTDNFKTTPFLHRTCKPIDTIDFRTDVEKGQMTLWDDECEGMCGV
jgi:hypothetical protein